MKTSEIIIVVFLISFIIGAFAHEKDMERNFLKSGDAKAWFSDIRCDGDKK